MSDTILGAITGASVIALALLGAGLFQHRRWTIWTSIVVGVIALVSITFQSYRAEKAHEQAANAQKDMLKAQNKTQEELAGIKNAANLILSGMTDIPITPRGPIGRITITRRDADIANRLGTLRHTGRKRYLEWVAGKPDAEAHAEARRIEVWNILNSLYGPKIASKFNEPLTTEAVTVPVPSGTIVFLNKAVEHGHRVDRLGQIIDDIVVGKISTRK